MVTHPDINRREPVFSLRWQPYTRLLINNIHGKISRLLSRRNARIPRNQGKLRHQLRHPGHALDLKTKDLIGHLWVSLINQNAWFVSSFCTELTLFCAVLAKNCTALNQLEWRNFFMYIIRLKKKVALKMCQTINQCSTQIILWLQFRRVWQKRKYIDTGRNMETEFGRDSFLEGL